MSPYPAEIEKQMYDFYDSLSEKDRRRYAAVESEKLGHGGGTYISNLLGCSRSTIAAGKKELDKLGTETEQEKRIRRVGGGRNSYEKNQPKINAAFLNVIDDNIAGDPMQVDMRWCNLSRGEIAKRLLERHNIRVSENVVKQLLRKHKLSRRKIQKKDNEG